MTQKCVADADYGKFRRTVDDMVRRVDESSIPLGTAMLGVQAISEGRFNITEPSSSFQRDLRKKGWRLLENYPRKLTSFADIETISFLNLDELSVPGEEMLFRARYELDANYGQNDAEWLHKHQEKIPKEFQRYVLVFPTAIWQDSNGRINITILEYIGLEWYLDFKWIQNPNQNQPGIWNSSVRLVRTRK